MAADLTPEQLLAALNKLPPEKRSLIISEIDHSGLAITTGSGDATTTVLNAETIILSIGANLKDENREAESQALADYLDVLRKESSRLPLAGVDAESSNAVSSLTFEWAFGVAFPWMYALIAAGDRNFLKSPISGFPPSPVQSGVDPGQVEQAGFRDDPTEVVLEQFVVIQQLLEIFLLRNSDLTTDIDESRRQLRFRERLPWITRLQIWWDDHTPDWLQ